MFDAVGVALARLAIPADATPAAAVTTPATLRVRAPTVPRRRLAPRALATRTLATRVLPSRCRPTGRPAAPTARIGSAHTPATRRRAARVCTACGATDPPGTPVGAIATARVRADALGIAAADADDQIVIGSAHTGAPAPETQDQQPTPQPRLTHFASPRVRPGAHPVRRRRRFPLPRRADGRLGTYARAPL